MKTLGVLDAIRMHPDAFRPLFCHEPSPLTADVLELSAVGRNKRRAEECVHFGGTTCWMLRVSIIASYGIKIFSYALLSVFVFPSFLKVFYMLGLIYFLWCISFSAQEGPLQLGGILAFTTGANDIPPLGFSPLPSVVFLHELPLRQGRHLPTANTCINCLRLPVLKKFEDFKETMDFALKNTQGFGQE